MAASMLAYVEYVVSHHCLCLQIWLSQICNIVGENVNAFTLPLHEDARVGRERKVSWEGVVFTQGSPGCWVIVGTVNTL